MKRSFCGILAAVFLSALCIPCAAANSGRAYPGFSDVAEGTASYEAIKLCYERGLMNGTSETAFSPQGKLNVAQLVVLAARLYDLRMGGSGEVPELPDLSQPYLRFYDEEGRLFASYSNPEELHAYNNEMESPYICISEDPDDSALPETCRLEIGFEDHNHVRSFEGVKESHQNVSGAMSHGLTGTGYRFQDPGAKQFISLPGTGLVEAYKDAWWFPAVFYLGSEGVMGFEGELVCRANSRYQTSGYDPLVRFSSDNASRSLFAWLVDLAAGELPVLNESLRAPDVDPYETPDAGAILRLYRAGVLTGVDQEGNFGGDRDLTRAQAAIMLARVLEPSLRVKNA